MRQCGSVFGAVFGVLVLASMTCVAMFYRHAFPLE